MLNADKSPVSATKKKSQLREAETKIEIPALKVSHMRIRIVGDSPLISHKWSEKAKEMMLSKQMKKAKGAKEAKNPEQDFRDSIYLNDDGKYAFPAVAFKAAAVNACTAVDGIAKTEARGAFHVIGEMIEVEGEPTMREDMVRIGMGTADIRYRAEYKKWACSLPIRYNPNVLSAEQIVNLFNTAGFATGVGEWRPQRNGSNGMFHVESQK